MTQRPGGRQTEQGGAPPERLAIEWAAQTNEQGGASRWFGSWLLNALGVEGGWFYGGHGGERTEHAVPGGVVGVRIRRWTSEGLDPEYFDLPLDGRERIVTAEIDFDAAQPHRLLARSEA
jgi:hypothetical protein